jgi:nucleotide-binding universal stress UspA family protein
VFNNVLVGVDRHLAGRDAVALATQLLAPGGTLTLAHIYPGDPRLRRTGTSDYRTIERRRALELLAGTRERAGMSAQLRCVEASSPGRGLRELARSIGADLLVVGSSHRGRLGRILLGDDARGALNGAPCVVAVAPVGYAPQSDRVCERAGEPGEAGYVRRT